MQEILARSLVQEETNAEEQLSPLPQLLSPHMAVTEAGAPRACTAPDKPLQRETHPPAKSSPH